MLREEKKWSQAEFAEKLYIDRSLVSKWEKGMVTLSSSNLISLSKLYKISVDEILAGERKNKNNEDLIDNIKLNIYDYLNSKVKRQKSRISILIGVIFISVFLLLLSFFINFYSSVKVYSIHTDENSVVIRQGLFFVTRDRVYFYLDFDSDVNEEDVDMVNIYYEIDNERKDVVSASFLDYFFFVDYNGYNEYVDFEKIDDFMNNLYLEINLKDGTQEKTKLSFSREYINNSIFIKKYPSIGNDKKISEEVYEKTALYEKAKKVYEKYKEDEGYVVIKYNKKKYKIIAMEDYIRIFFNDGQDDYEYDYMGFNSEFFYLNKTFESEPNEQIYSYNIQDKRCIEGNCETVLEDINIFEKIVDEILKK